MREDGVHFMGSPEVDEQNLLCIIILLHIIIIRLVLLVQARTFRARGIVQHVRSLPSTWLTLV